MQNKFSQSDIIQHISLGATTIDMFLQIARRHGAKSLNNAEFFPTPQNCRNLCQRNR